MEQLDCVVIGAGVGGRAVSRGSDAAGRAGRVRETAGARRPLGQGMGGRTLEARLDADPYLLGEFSALPDVLIETPEAEALTRNVQGLFVRIIGLAPYLPEELQLAAADVGGVVVADTGYRDLRHRARDSQQRHRRQKARLAVFEKH